jgi:hypothetical protein
MDTKPNTGSAPNKNKITNMLRDSREKPKTEKKTNTTNKGTKDLNPKTLIPCCSLHGKLLQIDSLELCLINSL